MNLTTISLPTKFTRWLGAALVLLGAILVGAAIGVFSQNLFWGFLAGLAGIFFLALAILHERVALYLLVAMFPLKGFPNDSSRQKSASSVAAHCKRDMRVGQAPNLLHGQN